MNPSLFDRVNQIRARHNKRVLSGIAVGLAAFFVGLWLLDLLFSGPQFRIVRQRAFLIGSFSVIPACFLFIKHALAKIKIDCQALGAICPSCSKELYPGRVFLTGGPSSADTGSCPNCGFRLGA